MCRTQENLPQGGTPKTWNLRGNLILTEAEEQRFKKHEEIVRAIYSMALIWRPRIIGVEDIGTQVELEQSVESYFESSSVTSGWLPRVIGIGMGRVGYKGIDKGSRIAGLSWRFAQGKIKIPGHRTGKWPYSELIHQIEDFTPDLAMLRYDDAIETLAMTQYLVHGKGNRARSFEEDTAWESKVAKGELLDKSGLPYVGAADLGQLSPTLIRKVLDRDRDKDYIEREKRKARGPYMEFRHLLGG